MEHEDMTIVTQAHINAVYNELKTAHEFYTIAAEDLLLSQTALKREKARALADGIIEGKNADARESAAQEHFSEWYGNIDEQQQHTNKCRLRLDLARFDVEEVRLLVRLDELEAHLAPEH